MWNIRKTIAFCNDEIFPKVNIEAWTGLKGELFDVVNMVQRFRRENNYPHEMTARVDDGFLFINDKPVGRIAPKMPKIFISEKAEYLENKILSMQERFD